MLPTSRTTLRRGAARARYDEPTIHAILDEALVCHVGFAVDAKPWVFPTAFARIGDHLYLHGAAANFGLKTLATTDTEACVTVTLLDGLVLSKSAFHHSMNYRSVMVFGRPEHVTDPVEKRAALEAIVEHMAPGRLADTRPPAESEVRATIVIKLSLAESSAKVRTGPPIEEPEDEALLHWSGVIPVSLVQGEPIPAVPADPRPTPTAGVAPPPQ